MNSEIKTFIQKKKDRLADLYEAGCVFVLTRSRNGSHRVFKQAAAERSSQLLFGFRAVHRFSWEVVRFLVASSATLNCWHYSSGSGGTGSGSKSSLKNNQKKKNSNGGSWLNLLSRAALSSLVTFLVLFVINLLIIYMIMFKNPDIADKLVEYIPHQYRDWILTKTEIFRLRVTDWISEFRTPPEEH